MYLKLGLQKRTQLFNDQLLGLHDGKEFGFVENSNDMLNVLKMLWRYGYSIKTLQGFVDITLNKFERLENEQLNV